MRFLEINKKNILSVSTADCRSLVVLQTGRRPRPRRDGSSCCWMSWSYWSTSETRWSGTWTPRKKSKLLKNKYKHKYKNTVSCTACAPVVSQTSPRSCGRRESTASLPCGAPARVGSLPGRRRQVKGQNVAPGTRPLHRWCSGVHRGTSCFTCICPPSPYPNPTPRHLTFWPFAVRRAEEEDEHLERTLEQNKGKMAKKEEKCVLQWLSANTTNKCSR